MKKSTFALFAASFLLQAGSGPRAFTGVITDSMCGTNHAMMKVAPDSKCVTQCVRAGSQYVLHDGKKSYKLSDQQTPQEFAGRKVRITGKLFEKTGILQVDRIVPAK
ncbi:MAG: hypothetical protein HY013_21105 [Candidatus Solibacter usitatus]|nr:hypothetical protein [Candidatus Solibacter usitatus]